MRTYVVRPGDSPASIAAQDSHAGCPKCANLLPAANPDLPTVTYPNGFKTFKELRVGQVINLPDAWFDGTLDRQPQSYFNALPYADGVTPGVGQAPALAPQPLPAAVEKKSLSTGAVVGIGLVAATVAGGITYAATREPKRRRRR